MLRVVVETGSKQSQGPTVSHQEEFIGGLLFGVKGGKEALSFPPVFLLIFLPMAPILSFPSSSVFVNFGCAGSSLQHAKLSQVAVCGLVCPAVCRILVP